MIARQLADVIDTLAGRALVAFDGPDAAGKSTLADHVAQLLSRRCLRASIDGFHRARALRLRRGSLSPTGYYVDSFDHTALTERLLRPFAAGAGAVTTAVFDYHADQPLLSSIEGIADDAVLLVDGVFLLRPVLRDMWSLSIYLDVPDAVLLARALQRDGAMFGSPETVLERYHERYLPAQALYRQEADPVARANIVIDNSDFNAPTIKKWF